MAGSDQFADKSRIGETERGTARLWRLIFESTSLENSMHRGISFPGETLEDKFFSIWKEYLSEVFVWVFRRKPRNYGRLAPEI